MKTFDKKDILTCKDTEEAEGYIGKEGYFGDTVSQIRTQIKIDNKQTLVCLEDTESVYMFNISEINASPRKTFALFLPANKVKDIRDGYRAFKNLKEFADVVIPEHHILGHEIVYRSKATGVIYYAVITRCYVNASGETFIILGNVGHSLQILFDCYEWQNIEGLWLPFGMLMR